GPGNDEGTLQPTARQRLHVEHLLGNAAFRPWALSDADAYNSRNEVDAGLDAWARMNSARARLRKQMLGAYPAAERALAEYYASAFGLQPGKAREVAAWALDLTFRSYFVFHRDEDRSSSNDIRTNPWPLQR